MSQMSSEKTSAGSLLGKRNGLVQKGNRVLVNGSALERGQDRLYPVYSSHNGVYQGKRYFYCPRGHGAMVQSSDITPLNAVPRKWPLNANRMFPSYEEIKKHRKLREQLINESQEKLRREFEARRRTHMERFLKSATSLSISVKDDEIDKQDHSQSTDEDSWEELNLVKMKKYFGNDEKAERMAQTLRKLRRAFEQGRVMILEQGNDTA